MEDLQHRLAAVWFADVVGYTRQSAEDEERALRVVRSLQEAARDVTRRYEGRIVKFIGDAVLAEFASTEAAVRAALRLEVACVERARHAGVECPTLRIGVHVGDVATTADGDVYGDGVNLASRIVDEAGPGEVWVSQDVWRQLRHRPRFRFEPRGKRELKGVDPIDVYAVVSVTEEAAQPTPGFGDRVRSWIRGSERRRQEAWPLRRRGVGLMIGVLVVGLGSAAWLVYRTENPAEGEGSGALDPARLAVLYFDDFSGGDLTHLAGGLTEAVINDLSQVEALDVISRYGVSPYREGDVPLDSIARVLRVGTIVEGSIARSGEGLRVTVQLIDAGTMAHLGSWTEERKAGELFALQDEIVQQISQRLRERLGTEIRLRQRREGTESVEAWELVQRAQRLRDQIKAASEPSIKAALRSEADGLLAQAESLDPRWIEPIVLRGTLATDEETDEFYQRAIEHAERALALRPRAADALALRGVSRYGLAPTLRDSVPIADMLAAAELDLRGAVAIDPSYAYAWIKLSDLLYTAKLQFADARRAAQRAYEEDEFLLEWWHFYWLCDTSLQLKDFDGAIGWCEEGRRRFPEPLGLIGLQLAILASSGGSAPDIEGGWRLAQEVEARTRAEDQASFVPAARMQVAAIAARAGLADSAQAIARRVRAGGAGDPFLDYYDAYVRLLLGERGRAIELLGSFLDAAPSNRAFVAHDHWFESLAGDPRFEAIVDRTHWPIFCASLCRKGGA
jgi:class 3 adenylate cyclase/TolB-like protein